MIQPRAAAATAKSSFCSPFLKQNLAFEVL